MLEVFITTHAIERYRERVAVNGERAEVEIESALVRPLFSLVIPAGTLWGCLNSAGYPFLALGREQGGRLVVETVGQRWHWHESRLYWKAYNRGSKRRYRVER